MVGLQPKYGPENPKLEKNLCLLFSYKTLVVLHTLHIHDLWASDGFRMQYCSCWLANIEKRALFIEKVCTRVYLSIIDSTLLHIGIYYYQLYIATAADHVWLLQLFLLTNTTVLIIHFKKCHICLGYIIVNS